MPHVQTQLQAALGDSYTIEGELGGGGMSRVFVATDTSLGRKVVVKMLSPELAGGLSAARFKREIELAASLQHPNVVPLLSTGYAGDVPYYTMPFVDGESLRAKLQREGELPIRQAVAILRDVARALDYAHSHGVIHRDIKPDNVLLSADYAVVTDFGVAKALLAARADSVSAQTTLTQLGVTIGTAAYMSPEQATGDTVDQRTDIYAFGCTAYEALTGAPPFSGDTQALFSAHATRSPISLLELRPSMPPVIAALVMACLEKRPADRPQNAREIIQALDAAATQATENTPPSHGRASRRSLGLAIGATALIGTVVAYLALRAPGPPVQSNIVAVTPFRVAGADPSLHTLREGMLDLIAAKLSGDMRALEPRTVLNAWHALGGSETTDLAQDKALLMASQLGAGRLLQGEVVGTPQKLVINASLVVAPNGRSRAAAMVTGDPSQLALLVDSLVAELFVQEAGGTTAQARHLAGIPLPTLQFYLAGQSLYRKGRYFDAAREFGRALDVDSTFALAAIQMASSAGWAALKLEAQRGRRLALLQYDKLAPRERVLLGGDDPRWLAGRQQDCVEVDENAERMVAVMPDMPETWYFLGDNLFHCGWVFTAGDDPWRRALSAFERALVLDSSFAPAREHLTLLYGYLGDSARVRDVVRAMRADSSDFGLVARYGTTAPLTGQDSAEQRDLLDRQLARRPYLARFAIVAAFYVPAYLRDAEYALALLKRSAATDAERRELAGIERYIALNRGQPQRAEIASRVAGTRPMSVLLDATFWDGDSAAAARTLPMAQRAFGVRPPLDSVEEWIDDVYGAAQFELARGDTTHARRAIALLRELTPPVERPWAYDRAHQLALLLEAQFASLSGRADALALLARLDSVVRRGPRGEPVLAVGALVTSRLWQRRGDLRRAYAAIRRVNYASTTPFQSTYRLERARVAMALGENREAVAQYRAYLTMRYDPEPSLRAQVASARTELERLERLSR